MLRRIAERKQEFMDQLPEDTAGQVRTLQDYEFLDPEAQHRFQDLVEQLRQSMTQSFFNDVQRMVEEMSEGDIQRMKDMVRAINDMLVQRMRGEEPDFDAFMGQYGDMFGENPPQSLDELLAQMQAQMSAMQSLMESLPPTQRQQLQSLLADKLGDPELEAELSELAQNLDFLNPPAGPGRRLPLPRRRAHRPPGGDGTHVPRCRRSTASSASWSGRSTTGTSIPSTSTSCGTCWATTRSTPSTN